MLTQLKLYGAALGAFLLAALAVFGATMKGQRDRARVKVDTLKATVHAERVAKKIIKEEKVLLRQRRKELIKEIKKEGENFEGVDNLTDSNDF